MVLQHWSLAHMPRFLLDQIIGKPIISALYNQILGCYAFGYLRSAPLRTHCSLPPSSHRSCLWSEHKPLHLLVPVKGLFETHPLYTISRSSLQFKVSEVVEEAGDNMVTWVQCLFFLRGQFIGVGKLASSTVHNICGVQLKGFLSS